MTALTHERNTQTRTGNLRGLPVAAATRLFAGGIGCINSAGYLTKGAVAADLVAVGRINQSVDNTAGGNGDAICEVESGVFQFDNSAGADAITLAQIGSDCYLVDDHTVAKTSATNTRSRAGKVEDVDDDGVWVSIG